MQNREPSQKSNGQGPGGRSLSKLLWRIFGVAVLVLFPLFLIFLLVGSNDQQWVRCEVIEANPSKGSSNSPSPWIVAIETQDCGRISYTSGVSAENVDDIAESFVSGEYEFRMGLASRLSSEGWIPFMNSTAEEYRAAQ